VGSLGRLVFAGKTEFGLKSVQRSAEINFMKLSSHIKPISYLKSHAADIVKSLSESREPMLITQNGEAKLVVMDVKSYEEQLETFALLKILALGSREIERGEFDEVDEVFTALDEADEE
jgi:prevent-host-death family protein